MDDQAIIALYFSRSENAIWETDRKYGKYCGSIAYHILRSKEDSEECVSDTWLRTWDAIPPNKPDNLKAFVGRITRNLSLDRYRERAAQRRGGGEVPLALEELKDCVGRGDNILSELEAKRLVQSINKFLRTLPKEKCNIFLMRYWFLKSISEISIATGFSEKKIKNELYRTRDKLKRYLEEEGFQV